jgi:methylenetetrahydrofolate reductase (NADPH)
MKISELLKLGRPLLSFEFFPPKTEESEGVLDETVAKLSRFSPDFVSITYGAGGSTRDKTLDWSLRIRNQYDLNVMMHLTCLGHSARDIDQILSRLEEEGVDNILALRGDPPKDDPEGEVKDDFTYASELVSYIRGRNGFSIGVAGHPEIHTEAASPEDDIERLRAKVDTGADFIITQLFFDNSYFFNFRDRAREAGIQVPIIPGVMPITNLGQVQRFTQMCGATVPDSIVRAMYGLDEEETLKVGVGYAIEQCRELLAEGAEGLHFYTLNRNQATELILNAAGGEISSV